MNKIASFHPAGFLKLAYYRKLWYFCFNMPTAHLQQTIDYERKIDYKDIFCRFSRFSYVADRVEMSLPSDFSSSISTTVFSRIAPSSL